ncbi:hypothetical protein CTA2_12631 [Colletotrichum tanaceti]|uniref:Uncharacterized protein n=1 Tax=Colletotrichum tanaceti TaxID=1306861 RepID=A0A4U6WYU3_9PEZI|nr:hypothetical protein CTA2_12631 [Colletotrichum tanaceti]TKW48342.1 hypothetical protein CTA1_7630 [Colletotrichum tanaceti]
MRTGQDDVARADSAEDDGRFALSPVDGDVIGILRQHLDAIVLGGVDKHTSAVVIAQHLLSLPAEAAPEPLLHAQPHCPRAPLAVILEPLEGAAATGAWEEAELAGADDLEGAVADLELAAAAAVIGAGTEAKVGAAAANEIGDAAVAGAVEDAAVTEVATTGDDEERASGLPGLLEEGGLGHGDDGVGGGQEAAEGVDAVADGLDGRAGAWRLFRG